jgi:ferredoxin--NADP+ reductase
MRLQLQEILMQAVGSPQHILQTASQNPAAIASAGGSAPVFAAPRDTVLFGKAGKAAAAQVPIDIYTEKKPLEAEVVRNEVVAQDVHHIVFKVDSKLKWKPGQCIKVKCPDSIKNNAGDGPHIAAYSIFNHYDPEKQELELLVKRLIKPDPNGGEPYLGRCSNYLCDSKPGSKVKLFGPENDTLVLPDPKDEPDINVVAVCGGTGLAPIHAELKDRMQSNGTTMLFHGVKNPDNYPYGEELEQIALSTAKMKLFIRFSDKENGLEKASKDNPADTEPLGLNVPDVNYRYGGYIQASIVEQGREVIKMLEKPDTYFLFCGSNPMLEGTVNALRDACNALGKDWDSLYHTLLAEGRWRVEAA